MTYKNLRRLAQKKDIILGSASPRRVKLLKETGLKFLQITADLDEANDSGNEPFEHAQELAKLKALAVASQTGKNEIVIGADTIVVLNGELIGKPKNESDAGRILQKLSGNRHIVCTAVAFVQANEVLASGYELTDVYFNLVNEAQISEYIRTGEPLDKAGAYGIQGEGAFLVDRIEGELDNVIGLPRCLLDKLAGEVCLKME